ncbi:Hypothetical predicted protein [Paramuricea clavata]|uniref:Uncharacterized protein n=1 Tax=Paramuricea clavata TaxID=317549 RepID=A0A6S7JJ13_PARCT|nr:Hypothetical predicted protein [Paramuricea clavata]
MAKKLTSDEEFKNMAKHNVLKQLQALGEDKGEENLDTMKERLRIMEQTCHFCKHSYLVFMVSCLYDEAAFYSDMEYEEITGDKISVQALVEAPEIYILARSSSDHEQLSYIETRRECLDEISNKLHTNSGLPINDVIFHGDSPSRQYECGQQKGGHYYCSVCGSKAGRVYEDLHSINCGQYEVLGFEPLHDIGKHIENIFIELPEHLPRTEAAKLKAVLEICIGEKETKKTFNYRCALVLTANQVRGKVNSEAQLLLDTLVEIQQIAYYDFTISLGTTQCYVEELLNRIISGRSSNVEEQEQVFNTINNITRTTSSYHASHITGNVFIRLEAEKKMKAYQTPETDKQEAHLTKLASTLPCFGNTTILQEMMVTSSSVWQAHSERISDFLLAGKDVWWEQCENGDITFNDGKGSSKSHTEGPLVHHFRLSNFKSEETYLKQCWNMCLKEKRLIPAVKLRIEDKNGNLVLESLDDEQDSADGEADKGDSDGTFQRKEI